MPWFSHRQVAQRLTAKKNVGTRRCLQHLSLCVFDHDNRCLESRTSRKERVSALPYGRGLPRLHSIF